ncbi:hypothetical protein Cgig2_000229 [Carnegiea gigantea]|uniref:DUF569 domain-containing protein n=1 Tax=Carnegiea gigantea TaxID=171969 RepID=A0A9Q1JT53_9CARY|nr:hypothetical protein Cgig2_000229 [Carnegiea gigantea]
MEFFHRAKVVRLRSQHNKFLTACDDEEGVKQTRHGSSKAARWVVETVEGKPNVIRLKSCQTWKYLSASDDHFLLGMTGKKVLQASPRARSDPIVEWEPLKEGSWVRLRTRKGNFLRANGGIPPWMNSVTHDVPSRSATQDWVLWMVDILEVDYQSGPLVREDDGVDHHDQTAGEGGDLDHEEGLSRSSSYSSTMNTVEKIGSDDRYEDCSEVGSPARSVHSSMEIPAPSPSASPKSARVSSLVSQHARQESQHSNSFHKLKSMLDGLNDLLDDKEVEDTKSEVDSEHFSGDSASRPHPLDVKMAKLILKELKNMDFGDILSSGRDKKLDKAVNILVADANMSTVGQVPKDLAYLQDRLKSMRNDHESASQDIAECTNFSIRKLEVKAELKKAAAKAHELETMEVGFTNMLATAKAKREELLRQLEEVENSIRAAERAQADNAVEIEELISRIGEKSESLREMERRDKSWQARRVEAERTLERVEEEWVQVKSSFQDV